MYAICLVVVLVGMLWLTERALRLEKQWNRAIAENQKARIDAEVQELVNSSLWRMDGKLTRIVGEEVSRPFYDYRAFYPDVLSSNWRENVGILNESVSQIVRQPSEFVKLHFEIGPNSSWCSPQAPTGEICIAACSVGVSQKNIDRSGELLGELQSFVKTDDLEKLLPSDMLPVINKPSNPWQVNALVQSSIAQNTNVYGNGIAGVDLPESQQSESNIAEPSNSPQQQTNRPSPQQQTTERGRGARGRRIVDNDQLKRNSASQSYALDKLIQRKLESGSKYEHPFSSSKNSVDTPKIAPASPREGVSRPIWINGQLLLARRAVYDGVDYIQGCWFDWETIEATLQEEISDLLPNAELVPVTNDEQFKRGAVLATLPVALDISKVNYIPQDDELKLDSSSPIRFALFTAWLCLGFGAVAIAVLLRGVVKLSERRASFVSAVTHELRTPLTTFRMYSEMLAGGMVKSQEKQQQYSETLKLEADRLSHLVENVLQFARLEHSGDTDLIQSVEIGELVDRFHSRLADRVAQSEMKLNISMPQKVRSARVRSDANTIEHIIFNLVDNACKYAKSEESPSIEMEISDSKDRFIELRIIDHGQGIEKDQLKKIFRPFSKSAKAAANSAPGVGLGLALCKRMAKQLNGKLILENSSQRDGTTFLLRLPISVG